MKIIKGLTIGASTTLLLLIVGFRSISADWRSSRDIEMQWRRDSIYLDQFLLYIEAGGKYEKN